MAGCNHDMQLECYNKSIRSMSPRYLQQQYVSPSYLTQKLEIKVRKEFSVKVTFAYDSHFFYSILSTTINFHSYGPSDSVVPSHVYRTTGSRNSGSGNRQSCRDSTPRLRHLPIRRLTAIQGSLWVSCSIEYKRKSCTRRA